MDRRTVICEFVGTALYVFFGVGSLVVAAQFVGAVGIALGFGFVLIGLLYTFGAVSGCHVNPAVTLGVLCARRIDIRTAAGYWVAQFAGAIAGAALLFLLAKQIPGLRTSGNFGSNGYAGRSAVGINTGGAFLIEVVMTFVLVFVFLTVTRRIAVTGFGVLAVGLTLTVVHLMGIPLTGTSVNPARSLGPAIFAGGSALSQLWLFLVAPAAGAILAALLYQLVHPPETAAQAAVPAADGPGEGTQGAGAGTGTGTGTEPGGGAGTGGAGNG